MNIFLSLTKLHYTDIFLYIISAFLFTHLQTPCSVLCNMSLLLNKCSRFNVLFLSAMFPTFTTTTSGNLYSFISFLKLTSDYDRAAGIERIERLIDGSDGHDMTWFACK